MPRNPIKLSVVIITLNEEKNIGKCLDAAWQVADEIIVVDSFSTDLTKIICEEKHATFVAHKFVGHIEQKIMQLHGLVMNMCYRLMQMKYYQMS